MTNYEHMEDSPSEHIEKKLTLLERQINKCDPQSLATAVSLQGDLSSYRYENHITEDKYFEYKSQLSSIVKTFLQKGCKK